MQDESQWPAYPDQGDHDESKDGEQQGQRDKRLHYHEPYRQQPLSYDVIFLREYMVAAVELLVELIVWIAELLEAIFPEAHVFKVAERFLVRLYPVRAGNCMRRISNVIFVHFKLILKSLPVAAASR